MSAAYRDVEARGWLEVRKGSGVYVRDLRQPTTEKSSLVELVEVFWRKLAAGDFRLPKSARSWPVCWELLLFGRSR